MTLYILDTDHISLFQKGHPIISKQIATINPNTLSTTIITAEEQIRGWFKAIRRASSGDKLIWGYTGLQTALNYFNSIKLLNFNQEAYIHYKTLRQQKIRIGTQDLRIAAIVLAVNGILVTRNLRDFSQVPELVFEDWSVS